MSQEIEQPATSSESHVDSEAALLLAQLRRVLAIPKPERAPDWEEATSKLAALVAVDFLKQPDDALALQELALVHLAGVRGCRAARKRELSPLRWRDRPPPKLAETFIDADEAKASAVGLSSLRASWVVPFVFEELRSRSLAPAHTELLGWAAANSSSLASLLGAAAAALPFASSDVLFEVTAIVLRPEFLLAHSVGEDFFIRLVDVIVDAAASSAEYSEEAKRKKVESLAVQAVGAVDALTALKPGLLIQAASVAVIREANGLVSPRPAAMKQAITRVLQRAASLLEVLQSIDGDPSGPAVADVARGYAKALPQSGKLTPEQTTLMRLAVPRTVSGVRDASGADMGEMEQSLATLLTEWDAFASSAASNAEIAQIGRQIDAVAQLAHVERFGTPGEVVPYEPFQHHPTSATGGPPLRVLITKPGVRRLRADGSFRVILKALAEPHDRAVET